jgi:hypothetical protein
MDALTPFSSAETMDASIVGAPTITASAHKALAWASRQGPVVLHRASASVVLSTSWEGKG